MSTKTINLREPGSCLNKAAPDEPLFVLRANDPLAAQTIRLWAAMSDGFHNPDQVAGALNVANDMERWLSDRNAPKCAPDVQRPRPEFIR